MGGAWVWLGVVIAAVPTVWLLVSLVVSHLISPERSGRDLIKRKAAGYGVDVARVPEAAWDEIVERNITMARLKAEHPISASETNWRANFIRQIDIDAVLIARSMKGEFNVLEPDVIRQTLTRHGVLQT